MKRFILLLTLFSCTSSPPAHPKQALTADVREAVIQKLKQENNLIPIGFGSRMMQQIEMLSLSFQYDQPITIDQGRALLQSSLQTYLDAIQANPTIQQYLATLPFSPKNIQIRIYIQDPDPSHLQYISAIDGILEFYTTAPDGKGFEKVHEEPFSCS